MKRIAVFCGSSLGDDPLFAAAAHEVGHKLAANGIELVYGGANVGLMGAVANSALSAGGKVIGVLPEFLRTKEIEHAGLSELIIVETMHQRKTMMHDLCSGIIALPGGFGTMEELFEVLTWAQLGLHSKPIGLMNVAHFYDALIHCIDHMVAQGLLRQVNRDMLLIDEDIDRLLEKMAAYRAPEIPKWISRETT